MNTQVFFPTQVGSPIAPGATTKAPTGQEVYDYVQNLVGTPPPAVDDTIAFNSADPNTPGTAFTPNFQADPDFLYYSELDGSTWVYDAGLSAYVSAPALQTGKYAVTGTGANLADGFNYFPTLAAALAAANGGDTVHVFADFVLIGPGTMNISKDVNIEGHGNTFTVTKTAGTSFFTFVHADSTHRINNLNIRMVSTPSVVETSAAFASAVSGVHLLFSNTVVTTEKPAALKLTGINCIADGLIVKGTMPSGGVSIIGHASTSEYRNLNVDLAGSGNGVQVHSLYNSFVRVQGIPFQGNRVFDSYLDGENGSKIGMYAEQTRFSDGGPGAGGSCLETTVGNNAIFNFCGFYSRGGQFIANPDGVFNNCTFNAELTTGVILIRKLNTTPNNLVFSNCSFTVLTDQFSTRILSISNNAGSVDFLGCTFNIVLETIVDMDDGVLNMVNCNVIVQDGSGGGFPNPEVSLILGTPASLAILKNNVFIKREPSANDKILVGLAPGFQTNFTGNHPMGFVTAYSTNTTQLSVLSEDNRGNYFE